MLDKDNMTSGTNLCLQVPRSLKTPDWGHESTIY